MKVVPKRLDLSKDTSRQVVGGDCQYIENNTRRP